jgi:hypothetical protein
MAVINSTCISISDCNELIIRDSSNWDDIPTTDIEESIFIVEYDGVVYTFEEEGYINEFTITPEDLNQSTTITDGIYKITVTYIIEASEYTTVQYVLQDCAIACQIDKLVLQLALQMCNDCNTLSEDVYKLKIKLWAICAALKCNDLVAAEDLLECLQSDLINYNCKNC